MVFSVVFSQVWWSLFLLEIKLVLGLVALKPVELHVHGFWCLRICCVSDKAMCSRVISCENRFRRVSYFLECLMQGHCIFRVVQESGKFSFRWWGHNMSDDCCQGEDSAILMHCCHEQWGSNVSTCGFCCQVQTGSWHLSAQLKLFCWHGSIWHYQDEWQHNQVIDGMHIALMLYHAFVLLQLSSMHRPRWDP